jgi:hypothetical protein
MTTYTDSDTVTKTMLFGLKTRGPLADSLHIRFSFFPVSVQAL